MPKSQPNYEERIFGSVGGRVISTIELAAVIEYLKPKGSAKILDVGTGTGRVARKILEASEARVIGIDIERDNIKNAKEKFSENYADKYDLIVADGQFLPFKNSSFDGITCIRTLKYFPNHQLGIREMSRILKNGGTLVLTLSNVFSIDSFLVRLKILAYRTLFNFRRLVQYLRHNNLVVVKYLGLHKIHPKIWTVFENTSFLFFLWAAEFVLQKITPKELLSREILVKLTKSAEKGV